MTESVMRCMAAALVAAATFLTPAEARPGASLDGFWVRQDGSSVNQAVMVQADRVAILIAVGPEGSISHCFSVDRASLEKATLLRSEVDSNGRSAALAIGGFSLGENRPGLLTGVLYLIKTDGGAEKIYNSIFVRVESSKAMPEQEQQRLEASCREIRP